MKEFKLKHRNLGPSVLAKGFPARGRAAAPDGCEPDAALTFGDWFSNAWRGATIEKQ